MHLRFKGTMITLQYNMCLCILLHNITLLTDSTLNHDTNQC